MRKKFISLLFCLILILQGNVSVFAEEFIVWEEGAETAEEFEFEEMTDFSGDDFGEDLIIDEGLLEDVSLELSDGDGTLAGELDGEVQDESETEEVLTLEDDTEVESEASTENAGDHTEGAGEPDTEEDQKIQESEVSSEESLENGAVEESESEGLIEEETERVSLIETFSEEMEVIELEDGIKVPDEVSTTFSFFRLAQYDGCFGNQLSGRAREIYDKRVDYYATKRQTGELKIVFDEAYVCETAELIRNEKGNLDFDEYNEIKKELAADMQASIDAFLYDYSIIFWLRGGKFTFSPRPEVVEDGYLVYIDYVTYIPNEIYSEASELMDEYDNAVSQTASMLQSNADINKDGRVEKLELILTIHDYLCERLYYDTPAYEVYEQKKAEKAAYEKEHGTGTWKGEIDYRIFSSGGAFLDQVGTGVVCEGYAKAFKQLCDKLGVACTLIGGQVTQSTGTMGHMWNGVQLNGKWYLMDVTWDDPSTKTIYTYFMKGNRFSNRVSSGKISGAAASQVFAYPALETEDLVYCTGIQHQYKEEVIAATCETQGYTKHVCQNCGSEYSDTYIESTGHDYKTNTKAATCTEKGYTTYTCINDNCDENYMVYHNPLGHSYKSVVTAPTCKKGYTTYTCTRSGCNHKYTGNKRAALGYHPYKNGICLGCGQGDTIIKATISKIASQGYDPKGVKPAVTVKFGTNVLKNGKDYKLTYQNNTVRGTAKVTITGIGNYRGTVTKSFSIVKKRPAKLTFSSIADATYTGKALKPKVTIKNNGTKLIKDTDYTITYSNNKEVGQAVITIKLKGNYYGSQKLYFNILPKEVSFQSVKSSAKGKMKVTWKKTTGNGSYQIQYSLNSNFKSAKTVTVKAKYTTKTIEKLTSKKTYYVRIRGYKKVDGEKYYSEWSKAKKVTIK